MYFICHDLIRTFSLVLKNIHNFEDLGVSRYIKSYSSCQQFSQIHDKGFWVRCDNCAKVIHGRDGTAVCVMRCCAKQSRTRIEASCELWFRAKQSGCAVWYGKNISLWHFISHTPRVHPRGACSRAFWHTYKRTHHIYYRSHREPMSKMRANCGENCGWMVWWLCKCARSLVRGNRRASGPQHRKCYTLVWVVNNCAYLRNKMNVFHSFNLNINISNSSA